MEKKNTKKVFKAEYTVDLTDVVSYNDVVASFGYAKLNKGLAINPDEHEAILCNILSSLETAITCCTPITVNVVTEEKKPNIFKRFWNWITRK